MLVKYAAMSAIQLRVRPSFWVLCDRFIMPSPWGS